MSSNWLVIGAGALLVLIIIRRIIRILHNILGVYVFRKPINLQRAAGASWAVITGSTDGIGKGYAFELAAREFNVYLVSRTQSKLDAVREEILHKHPNIEVKTAAFDFKTGSPSAYQDLLSVLNKVEIGVLINNVGMCYDHPDEMHKVEMERLGDTVVVDTLPPTLLTAGILPQMLHRRRGVIVNIGSFAGSIHVPLVAAYSACKKYVEWLTGILQMEYKDSGVTFQNITPLLVATNMTEIKKSSFFTPDPLTFAKSALDTIGLIPQTTGYLAHQIQHEIIHLVPGFLLDYFVMKRNEKSKERLLAKRRRETQGTNQRNDR